MTEHVSLFLNQEKSEQSEVQCDEPGPYGAVQNPSKFGFIDTLKYAIGILALYKSPYPSFPVRIREFSQTNYAGAQRRIGDFYER